MSILLANTQPSLDATRRGRVERNVFASGLRITLFPQKARIAMPTSASRVLPFFATHRDRRWRKGRYGKGQVLWLADSKLLLVVSESGDLFLLSATPDEYRELAKLAALDGKTWNYPVVGDRLYLRNAKEAVCCQLTETNH
jgi:hypothetical protein